MTDFFHYLRHFAYESIKWYFVTQLFENFLMFLEEIDSSFNENFYISIWSTT